MFWVSKIILVYLKTNCLSQITKLQLEVLEFNLNRNQRFYEGIILLSYPFINQLNLPNYSAIYFLFFSAIALSLPSAPSGIGTVHYGLYLAVQILMGGDASNSQSDLIAALIISLHLLLVILDVIVGGAILLVYRQKNNIKFVNS